jgi:hypothetical protein
MRPAGGPGNALVQGLTAEIGWPGGPGAPANSPTQKGNVAAHAGAVVAHAA